MLVKCKDSRKESPENAEREAFLPKVKVSEREKSSKGAEGEESGGETFCCFLERRPSHRRLRRRLSEAELTDRSLTGKWQLVVLQ